VPEEDAGIGAAGANGAADEEVAGGVEAAGGDAGFGAAPEEMRFGCITVGVDGYGGVGGAEGKLVASRIHHQRVHQFLLSFHILHIKIIK